MFSTFEAKCDATKIIAMQHANYGRMKLGQCIDNNLLIGCYGDVLALLDKSCSGKHRCAIEIPNTNLQKHVQCLGKGMIGYLEASYNCQSSTSLKLIHYYFYYKP